MCVLLLSQQLALEMTAFLCSYFACLNSAPAHRKLQEGRGSRGLARFSILYRDRDRRFQCLLGAGRMVRASNPNIWEAALGGEECLASCSKSKASLGYLRSHVERWCSSTH